MIKPRPCPVCTGISEALDVVDFNKSCEELRGTFLPMAGVPVYYFMCGDCGHVFSPEFQEWSDEDYLARIYNEDYVEVDPDYEDARPNENARFLIESFGRHAGVIRHLDYGGGNGRLSALLSEAGWDSTSFDPFPSNSTDIIELGEFNFITAFEVFEHVPRPDELMTNLLCLMADSCLVLFSTLVSDGSLKRHERINWWYCSPRNGHISIFSKRSLEYLGKQYDLHFMSFNAGMHAYANDLPDWAAGVIRR